MPQDLSNLLASTANELEQILSTKTVVGAPIQLNGSTVVPLLGVGFGLGVGSGSGKQAKQGDGDGQALACGGGVRPIAVIIADANGVRVEGIHGAAGSVVEKLADTVGKALGKVRVDP